MSLLTEQLPVRGRDRGGRGVRHFIPCCQVWDCTRTAGATVTIELPQAWERSGEYTAVKVVVVACRECAPELERRAAAVLQARRDLVSLLTIVERAAEDEGTA